MDECELCGEIHDDGVTYAGPFVNVYLEDRSYGGPEEGGWWYDHGTPVRSTQIAFDMGATEDIEREWCRAENARRRSDIGSVLSEGRYVVRVECRPGRAWPEETPHYE